jgi:hypothetical protein
MTTKPSKDLKQFMRRKVETIEEFWNKLDTAFLINSATEPALWEAMSALTRVEFGLQESLDIVRDDKARQQPPTPKGE